MGRTSFVTPFPWSQYSRKTLSKIDRPRGAGFFSEEEAQAKQMHLATGSAGSVIDCALFSIYFLVDKEDGVIADAKYQLFGPSILIAIAEASIELLVGKNYDQAKRMSADLIEQQLKDKKAGLPEESFGYLNLAVDAIEQAASQCSHIPLAMSYVAPPIPDALKGIALGGDGYPGWPELSSEAKRALIEEVLNQDVRPYIALDGGGVELLQVVDDRHIVIAYQGACTSCFSSTGATLSYIQQVLKGKLHPELTVIPDLSYLEGHSS
ncbi:MAG: hypothetical protein K0S07_1001 [Chlamydiales bacterium]|jgi:NifU-like protein|nr:hypothetical protein [Chlamydiales bacterium]